MNEEDPYQTDDLIDGRYRVVTTLGSGGFGTVYLAEELDQGDIFDEAANGEPVVLRRVAVKVLRSPEKNRRRFAAEIRSLCRLHHPGLVTVHHFGRREYPYVVMEYIDGGRLFDARNPVAFDTMLRRLVHVAEALAHAHAQGVVHRDLKPDNILIRDNGLPVIVDFGLAYLLQRDDPATQRVGTPGFIAPELLDENIDPEDTDHRADIYGLGATIYAAFVGRSPFAAAGGTWPTLRKQLDGTVEYPDDFPLALQPLIERCLEHDPIHRPRSASDVAEELRAIAIAATRASARRSPVSAEIPRSEKRVDLRDTILEELEPFEHPKRGPGVRFRVLERADDGELRSTGGFVYGDRTGPGRSRAYTALCSAWNGVEASIYGALEVTTSGGGRYLALDSHTLVVLEPYFPVSVSYVAKVEGVRAPACATRYLVDLRDGGQPSHYLTLGALAHDMLEHLVEERLDATDASVFRQLFERLIAERRLSLLAAGQSDDDVRRMATEVSEHFTHLVKWTSPESSDVSGKNAEVQRFSGRYGLEGRIDLTLSTDDTLRIIELKTGKHLNPEHERQLRCYALMWDPIAQARGQRVEGKLLYSKKGQEVNLQRREHAVERQVISARNDIIAMHRWFSSGDTDVSPPEHQEFRERCNDEPCRWRRSKCAEQSALLGNVRAQPQGEPVSEVWGDIDPQVAATARRYYAHFVRLIEREYRAESRAMGDVYRVATIDERVHRLHAMRDVAVAEVDIPTRTVRLAFVGRRVFDVGDRVVLHRGDFDSQPVFALRVIQTGSGWLRAAVPAAAELAEERGDGWVLDKREFRIGYRDLHRALYRFIATRDSARLETVLLPALLGQRGQREMLRDKAQATPANELTTDEAGRLNDSQLDAVRKALEDHTAFLIQGPPGTGKTTVIAELVRQLVSAGQRVLVAAATNTAVDTALARILRAGVVDVIRVGTKERAGRELLDALGDAGRPVDAHFSDDLARGSASLKRLRMRIENTRVVAATANACVSNSFFDALEQPHWEPRKTIVGTLPLFDVVIIDEASQLTEPLALGPICRAKRFVLVGDDKQLPPVITAPDAVSAHVGESTDLALAQQGVAGLDRSLFERLKPHVPHAMLTVQYRMNERVQAFPSQCFYERRLVAAPSVAGRTLDLTADTLTRLDDELRRRLDPDRPSVWVGSTEAPNGRVHAEEVREIARTASALVRAWCDSHSVPNSEVPLDLIGIVAPFRAQCHAIRRALSESLGDVSRRVEVDTVERFQGREKEAMLVSLVTPEWSAFTMDARRLNVTLTRARTKVIVFGRRELGRQMVDAFSGQPTSSELPEQAQNS